MVGSAVVAHLLTKKVVLHEISARVESRGAQVHDKRRKVNALLKTTLRAKVRERNLKILELLRLAIYPAPDAPASDA